MMVYGISNEASQCRAQTMHQGWAWAGEGSALPWDLVGRFCTEMTGRIPVLALIPFRAATLWLRKSLGACTQGRSEQERRPGFRTPRMPRSPNGTALILPRVSLVQFQSLPMTKPTIGCNRSTVDSGFGTRYSLPFFLVRVFHCSFHQHLRFLLQPLDGHHAEVFVEQRLAGLDRFLGLRVLLECCLLLAELPLTHRQQQPVEGVAALAQIHRLLDRVGCILPLLAAVLG